MIRIGFLRFWVTAEFNNIGGGRVELRFGLTPQAKKYHTLVTDCHRSFEKDVIIEAKFGSRIEDVYSLRGKHILAYTREIAGTLASDMVNQCLNQGAVDYQGFGPKAAIHLVQTAIINAATTNQSDEIGVQADCIDLVPDIVAMREEREREAARQYMNRPHGDAAVKRSMELLYCYLNAKEKEELAGRGHITVENNSGVFVIPVATHGLVRQYVEGNYLTSHCVVFQDASIPVGDEVLMKVALIKSDYDSFEAVSNKFIEPQWRGSKFIR